MTATADPARERAAAMTATADPARVRAAAGTTRSRRRPRPRPLRDAPRTRVRRALHALSAVLIVAGALVVLDAAVTVAWQEPITGVLARRAQDRLADRLRALEASGQTDLELAAMATLRDERSRVAYLAGSLRRRTPEGDPVARIDLPRLGSTFVVVAGSSPAALRKGPGLYTGMPFPGEGGTVAIAGHRTTYLAPFRHLDALRPGDPIVIEMPYATFTYRVATSRIVAPDDLAVLRGRGDRLVLTACNPLFSASQRIAVVADLVRTSGLPRSTHQTRVGRVSEHLKRRPARPDGVPHRALPTPSTPTIAPAPAQ